MNIQLLKIKVRHVAGNLAADHNPLDERLRAMALVIGPPTPESYLEARLHVEESLKVDAGSAESWALLARVLMSEYLNGWNDIGLKDVDRAEEAYKQALAIDPSVAVAHYAAGFVRRVRGDHAGALYQFEKAIELNSNLQVAYVQKANELVFLGRVKEAVTAGKKAVSLSPRDPSIGVFYWVIGRAYLAEGDYKESAVWLSKSVEERPNLWFNRAWLISAYSLTGHDREARGTLDDFIKTFPMYTLPRKSPKSTTPRIAGTDNDTIRAASKHLFVGLKKAGLH